MNAVPDQDPGRKMNAEQCGSGSGSTALPKNLHYFVSSNLVKMDLDLEPDPETDLDLHKKKLFIRNRLKLMRIHIQQPRKKKDKCILNDDCLILLPVISVPEPEPIGADYFCRIRIR